MSKPQNRCMGNRRRQRNMTPQKVNDHTIEEFVDSEGDEISFSDIRGMMITMFKELKEDIQNPMTPK
jgi:hypothetical protein